MADYDNPGIPTDDEVCGALVQIENATARDLRDRLISLKFESLKAQRAIQRCIDRGRILIKPGFRLEVA